jgi:hypothetical protein
MAKKKTAKAAKKAAKPAVKRATARKNTRAGAKTAKRGGAKASKPGASKRNASRSSGKGAKTAKVAKTARTAAKRAASPARRAAKRAAEPAQRAAKRPVKSAAVREARKAAEARTAAATSKRPNLDRERRTIREEEEMVPSPPSSLNLDRSASAARTGRAEFEQRLREHTSTGPALTGGDVDADWEDAETVGDEAPGGDNPTPDQDVVDEIGRAMGIEYDDNEELKGGDELVERDRHRWELDPASKEEFEDE